MEINTLKNTLKAKNKIPTDTKMAIKYILCLIKDIEIKQVKLPDELKRVINDLNDRPLNSNTRWSTEDIFRLKKYLKRGYTIEKIAKRLKRTKSAVDSRVKQEIG